MEKNSNGRLFLIGGAADTIHEKLFELAGGREAKIVLLPHASGIPDEVGEETRNKLEAVGFTDIVIVSHEDNEFDIPDGTTCVYALGGDQSRLVERLGENGMAIISRFIREGGLYAGTSAGTACVGELMIAGGMSDGVLSTDNLELKGGLALVSGIIFDQHFRNRNRFNRLMLATASVKYLTGIGIDEDTACLVYPDGKLEVFGVGQVTIFENRRGTHVQEHDGRQSAVGLGVTCLSPDANYGIDGIQFQTLD